MRIIVFGAHPDDMEIGMGGTIAKHVEAGDDILMVVATVPSQRELRTQEARAGAEVLGARLEILDIPPDDLGVNRRTIREFDRLLTSVDPHLVYTHWDQDSHQDHNAVSRAILAAGRRNRCSVLMYEQTIPGGVTPGGFKAQSFVDITDYIDRKCRSILVHRTQIDQNGGDWWLDGVRGRAMYRGWLRCAWRVGVGGIAPWMFAPDSRPDDWDDFTFYYRDGTRPEDPLNRYTDLIIEAVGRSGRR